MIRRRHTSTGMVGIDLGASSMKLLQLREQRGRLSVIGAVRLDDVDIVNGDGRQIHACTEKLHSVMTSGMFIGRRCVVSLPREDVRVQAVRLPSMRDDELAEAAAWEASQRFNIDREELTCDYVRTDMIASTNEGREEILLIGVPTDLVSQRLEPIVQAGFRPAAVDVGFAATARSFSRRFRRDDDRDTVRAILDVGYTGSSVTIIRGDQIAFSKPIEIGGAQFNDVVAEHLQIEPKAAAELRAARIADVSGRVENRKSSEDHEFDPTTDRAIYEATRPLIGRLVKEVVLCLRYYGVTFRGRPPQTIIITGGDGLEPHLAELVEQSCKAKTAFDDEAGTLAALMPQIAEKCQQDPGPAASWSLAVGLAMRDLAIGAGSVEVTDRPKEQAA